MHSSNIKQPRRKQTSIDKIKVNGEIISEEMIAKEVECHSSASLAQAIHSASEALVIHKLLFQSAKIAGTVKKSETEMEAIDRLLEQNITPVKISEKQCKDYFYANRDKFYSPTLLDVRHILLLAAPDDEQASDEMESLAQILIDILKERPEQFHDLARQYSACPSKHVGGSLRKLTKGCTINELEEVMFAAPLGLCEKPIRTRFGYHVISVEHRVEAQPLPFTEVKELIANYLEHLTYRNALSQYLSTLVAQAEIEGIEMEA